MSTVKNPEEKKILSLKLDRRNTYGENAKASRKSIPRAKQRTSKQTRHAAVEVLMTQKSPADLLDLDAVEAEVKDREVASKHKAFRKHTDGRLAHVLLDKKMDQGRWRRSEDIVSDHEIVVLRNSLTKKQSGA
jgi:hypothetical protein